MQRPGGGNLDGAQLDRAGEERNLALGESETFKRDRKRFGEVESVSIHRKKFIPQTDDTEQGGLPLWGAYLS